VLQSVGTIHRSETRSSHHRLARLTKSTIHLPLVVGVGATVLLNGSSHRLNGIALNEIRSDFEAGNVAFPTTLRVPITGDLYSVLFVQHGIENRLKELWDVLIWARRKDPISRHFVNRPDTS